MTPALPETEALDRRLNMATTTARPFPIDRLLTCGHCPAEITLSGEPETRYSCPNSCLPAFQAAELNRLVISAATGNDKPFRPPTKGFHKEPRDFHGKAHSLL